ncbi:squalene/phytoene synthase family protein [Halogeometricum borinquense]|uniref:Farnesyl-diphosphate farnesyltransferase n=2 Tax=Halogeometricum borinquense TaxID=60847 RepID=E4NPJ6_HALBP|nr:phytoene/squalene synthase family protein [Halogeometricum borinquense]ADQ67666.1 farnesyl-diphosphate farnesyltransferase [Halogeometricum borinquense DSM 11551]ELY23653.1 farnesyl-diphosphate farnesyltransferase [Halogeometricum borinquense DSM 11551]QIB73745.1 squalene/phytoene synthase family protein [Halogeometricum borinquense]QIQ76897.1 squalene/phytoene synthase family protein [Halogeometricum borinquense]RYJ13387.1 squalene/phytoene synthase family protein [Halogeometricum borinque
MSQQDERPQVDRTDLEWCHEAVQGVSRTFALTVDVLDEPMSSYICVGYLVCRIADTVEDASRISPPEQADLLRTYDAVLDPDNDTTVEEFVTAVEPHLPEEMNDDWRVVRDAPRVIRTFEHLPEDVRNAVTPPARELVQGMALFVERYDDTGGLRIQSREELEEYCYYAAGTVGNLITNLVTRGDISADRRRQLYDTAEQFGLLLQLVNISKDVYDDYTAENNVYLPAEWLAAEGVPQDEVVAPEHEEAASSVVRRTAEHAASFLDDAQTYLETVPATDGNTLAAWAVPFLLSVGTLRELLARPEDALSKTGVKVSRKEVFAVVAEMSGDTNRDALAEIREQIAAQPYHRAPTSAD